MNEPSDTWWVSEQVVVQWSYLFPSVIPRSARYAMILRQSLKRTYFVSGSFIQNWEKKKDESPTKLARIIFLNIPFSSQKQTRKRIFNSVILRVEFKTILRVLLHNRHRTLIPFYERRDELSHYIPRI